eukprot:TRINITY_DN6036_c0_g2_i1.p1 TRINITY_DN6036_c0_g2~~TRINITY_DN6036_c0_g2_i1.p1  ORF type:complete len:1252 (+),score=48.53 TRINITY_DN6036_c0_g2_i1:285-3758(+)
MDYSLRALNGTQGNLPLQEVPHPLLGPPYTAVTTQAPPPSASPRWGGISAGTRIDGLGVAQEEGPVSQSVSQPWTVQQIIPPQEQQLPLPQQSRPQPQQQQPQSVPQHSGHPEPLGVSASTTVPGNYDVAWQIPGPGHAASPPASKVAPPVAHDDAIHIFDTHKSVSEYGASSAPGGEPQGDIAQMEQMLADLDGERSRLAATLRRAKHKNPSAKPPSSAVTASRAPEATWRVDGGDRPTSAELSPQRPAWQPMQMHPAPQQTAQSQPPASQSVPMQWVPPAVQSAPAHAQSMPTQPAHVHSTVQSQSGCMQPAPQSTAPLQAQSIPQVVVQPPSTPMSSGQQPGQAQSVPEPSAQPQPTQWTSTEQPSVPQQAARVQSMPLHPVPTQALPVMPAQHQSVHLPTGSQQLHVSKAAVPPTPIHLSRPPASSPFLGFVPATPAVNALPPGNASGPVQKHVQFSADTQPPSQMTATEPQPPSQPAYARHLEAAQALLSSSSRPASTAPMVSAQGPPALPGSSGQAAITPKREGTAALPSAITPHVPSDPSGYYAAPGAIPSPTHRKEVLKTMLRQAEAEEAAQLGAPSALPPASSSFPHGVATISGADLGTGGPVAVEVPQPPGKSISPSRRCLAPWSASQPGEEPPASTPQLRPVPPKSRSVSPYVSETQPRPAPHSSFPGALGAHYTQPPSPPPGRPHALPRRDLSWGFHVDGAAEGSPRRGAGTSPRSLPRWDVVAPPHPRPEANGEVPIRLVPRQAQQEWMLQYPPMSGEPWDPPTGSPRRPAQPVDSLVGARQASSVPRSDRTVPPAASHRSGSRNPMERRAETLRYAPNSCTSVDGIIVSPTRNAGPTGAPPPPPPPRPVQAQVKPPPSRPAGQGPSQAQLAPPAPPPRPRTASPKASPSPPRQPDRPPARVSPFLPQRPDTPEPVDDGRTRPPEAGFLPKEVVPSIAPGDLGARQAYPGQSTPEALGRTRAPAPRPPQLTDGPLIPAHIALPSVRSSRHAPSVNPALLAEDYRPQLSTVPKQQQPSEGVDADGMLLPNVRHARSDYVPSEGGAQLLPKQRFPGHHGGLPQVSPTRPRPQDRRSPSAFSADEYYPSPRMPRTAAVPHGAYHHGSQYSLVPPYAGTAPGRNPDVARDGARQPPQHSDPRRSDLVY